MLISALPYAAAGTLSLTVVAASEATDPGTGLAPYIGGGATAILAAALAEVMRRMLNGTLISRATREQEIELSQAIVAAGHREDQYMRLAVESRDQAAKIAAELAVVTKAQTQQLTDSLQAMTSAVRDLREEVREDRRDRGH